MLPSTLDAIFEKGKRQIQWAFLLFSLTLCLGLQTISCLTSYYSREHIAEAIVTDPKIHDGSTYLLTQQQAKSAKQQAYDSRIQKLEASEAKRLQQAHTQHRELIHQAIHSKGTQMAQLYQQGNSWAAKQLAPNLQQAKARGEQLLKTEHHKVAHLKAERDSVILAMQREYTRTHNILLGENQTKEQKYKRDTQKYQSYAIWIGIGSTIVYLLMTIFLALHRQVSGLRLTQANYAPPLIHALFGVITRGLNTISRIIYTLSEKEEMQSISPPNPLTRTKEQWLPTQQAQPNRQHTAIRNE